MSEPPMAPSWSASSCASVHGARPAAIAARPLASAVRYAFVAVRSVMSKAPSPLTSPNAQPPAGQPVAPAGGVSAS